MQPSLIQSQQQRLQQVLAPQMRQSLEFLQVPLLELRTLIQRELEQNPTLEEQPDDHTPLEVETGRADIADPEGQLDFQKEYETLARLDDEWRDYFQQSVASAPAPSSEEAARRQHVLDSLTHSETLQEHLLSQLGFTGLAEEDRRIATLLIGCVNDDGYLNSTLGELAETTGQPAARLERVLAAIQDLDPVGVGARDLRECLQLQLVRLGKADGPEARLVRDHLEALAERRYEEVAAATGLTVAQTMRAAQFLGTLDPKPGGAFAAGEEAAYIVPEVTVQKLGGDYVVTLNNERLPRVRISKHYRQLMEDPATPKETRDYIRDKIRAGAFMMRSLHQRQQTILGIAREIVRIQRDFFEHGVSHLRPLVMADIAKLMGLHETTVSRALAQKYMQTPRGAFEMKYFFTPGYRTADGQAVSNKAVKEVLRELVDVEDPDRPLSDQELMEQLRQRGFPLARRTVAKYREELEIPPSHRRKA